MWMLQLDESLIHVLKSHLTHFIKNTMLEFDHLCQVTQLYWWGALASLDVVCPASFTKW